MSGVAAACADAGTSSAAQAMSAVISRPRMGLGYMSVFTPDRAYEVS